MVSERRNNGIRNGNCTRGLAVEGVLRKLCKEDIPAFLTPSVFRDAPEGLLLWEAFVTGKRTTTHEEDASAAALEFKRRWPEIDKADALPCVGTEVISLGGLALLRTGWSKDVRLLWEKPIVIRPER